MKPRVTQIVVVPEGEPIFAEGGYTISIVDECGGEFIVIEDKCEKYDKIGLNKEDWPALRAVINRMVRECRDEEE